MLVHECHTLPVLSGTWPVPHQSMHNGGSPYSNSTWYKAVCQYSKRQITGGNCVLLEKGTEVDTERRKIVTHFPVTRRDCPCVKNREEGSSSRNMMGTPDLIPEGAI
jgi:hypothetical protein